MTQTATYATAAPLVETKLHAPRRRRGVVHRPRLTYRLVGRQQPALTVVSAPAGFGKTTLLTDWFANDEGDRSTAWLSLDTRDNDPAVFLSYLVAALQSVAPDVGATALSLLQSSPSSLDAVVATLVNDLDALAADIVLVLDDYHVIESTELHEAVVFLLEHLPPQLHLVVASRADPPFPLARLRARGELLEIRIADLRFTADEAAAYFSDTMGLELTGENIVALEARTEGWIAALQLAALSMQGRDDIAAFIDNFTGNDRFVVDYLAEEVLERQPAEVRSFLLQTAVLSRLTGSLCDAVTGRSGGAATLDELDRTNLFLVPLDDRRQWYRYHHLFGDVLRARLLSEQPERVHELHRRASAWYESNDDLADAISHALAGDDPEGAARLIELTAPAMRQARQEETLRLWLEAAPHDLFHARPVLSVLLVGARMASGNTTGVEPLLRNVEEWLNGRADSSQAPIVFDRDEFARLPAQVAMYRAALALLAGDIPGTVSHANRIVALAAPADHIMLGGASALTGLAHWAVGELEAARTRYAEAVQHFIDAHFIPDVLGCSLALGDIHVAQGRLEGARATFAAGLEHASDQPGLRGTADMHVGLSELFLERNELDQAAEHLRVSRELGEHAGLPQHAYRWRAASGRLLAIQGDLDGALELLDQAERFYNTDFSPAVRPIPALKARLHLARGDLAAARQWATDRGVSTDDALEYVQEFEHITLGRLLLADAGDRALEAVVNFLQRLLAAAEQGGRTGSVVEIDVLLARARHLCGDTPGAMSTLEDALIRAAPERYVRVFLDEGPTVIAMMHNASLHGAAGEYAQRLLGARPSEGIASARSGLVDELSSRELDVLRLLRSDLSGPDIARELLVSLNTLRTHTKNIYTKLGVNNRREAIRRAAELGL